MASSPATTVINVPGPPGAQPYVIQLTNQSHGWTEPSIYAPALQGVMVALVGLWIAHRLAWRRERRTEILQHKKALQDLLSEVETICAAAWLAEPGPDRIANIKLAKARLQDAGVKATDLNRKTKQGIAGALRSTFADRPMSINVIYEIAQLRDVATGDPFEEPMRPIDDSHIDDISAIIREINAKTYQDFFALFG